MVETAFSLNGLGAYLVKAAQAKDLAVVQGISLVLVAAFVVINVVVDVLYAVLDPRVSLGSGAPRGASERDHRVTARPARRRPRGARLLRSTGAAGIDLRGRHRGRRAVLAVFGPLLAPYNPVLPNTELPFVGPSAATCSASTSRAATCCPGCWPARSRRCSGRSR